MSGNKTTPTSDSVAAYLGSIEDAQQRNDAEQLVSLMRDATGMDPVMWGSSIVGFGNYHYVYDTGREGDAPAVSFAARKGKFSLYGVMHFEQNDKNLELVKQLGQHSSDKGCLHLKTLNEVNLDVLRAMIANAFKVRENSIKT